MSYSTTVLLFGGEIMSAASGKGNEKLISKGHNENPLQAVQSEILLV